MCVFDLETIVDSSLWSPPVDAPDTFPPAYACQIVCIGRLWLDEQMMPVPKGLVAESGDEKTLIQQFTAGVVARQPRLISWNGRGFDVPVLSTRAFMLGVALPWWSNCSYRYKDTEHADIMDLLTGFGAARGGIPLDAIARGCGLPGKQGVTGGDVAGLIAAGERRKVEVYCEGDVVQTAFLAMRYELLKGNGFTLDHYRAAAGALLDFVAPRLPELVAAIDRPRLLLEE
jgi:predicted PolB exonuclease-like 3'-5' exonuclease